jgi:hypothetical protein
MAQLHPSDFSAMQVRERHFGGRQETQVPVAGNLEQVRLELRQALVLVSAAVLTRNGGSISR